MNFPFLRFIFGLILLQCFCVSIYAQTNNDSIKRKKAEPQSMADIFHSNKLLLGKGIISGKIFYNLGRSIFQDSLFIRPVFNHSLAFAVKVKLFEEVSFNTTVFANLNKDAIMPWTSDFYYSLMRFNWRPNTFSYGYENYLNNRYTDSSKDLYKKFLQGNFFISYGHDLAPKLLNAIKLDNTTNIRFTFFARYAPQFADINQVIHTEGKFLFGLSARYTIWKRFYAESSLNFYLDANRRLPWDPDFTYGFGYFDWRPFKFSFSYGNWVVNRFKGKPEEYKYYGFWDGSFQIAFNYVW